jgi:hypothetical protein
VRLDSSILPSTLVVRISIHRNVFQSRFSSSHSCREDLARNLPLRQSHDHHGKGRRSTYYTCLSAALPEKKKTLRNSVTISQSPPPLQPAQIKRNRSIANQKNTKKDICTMLVSQHRKTLTIEELSEILRCSSTGNRTLVSRDL